MTIQNENPRLTVLSFGGGQDSTTILRRLINDPEFRQKWAPNDLLVVMSDTGDEHPETYKHVEATAELCQKHGIEFRFLKSSDGFHIPSWPGLIQYMRRTNTVIMKGGPKSCTDKLKIQPIYKFLDQYVGQKYGYKWGRKRALKEFEQDHGRIRVMVGIAAGEESRIPDAAAIEKQEKAEPWWKTIERVYPLVDLGWDRQACQDYMRDLGVEIPLPSNCMRCPYMSDVELVWLHRFHQEKFDEWCDLEDAKIAAQEGSGKKNHGVWNSGKRLREVLKGALEKYGSWSDEQLQEYKMSHGHCVKSRY